MCAWGHDPPLALASRPNPPELPIPARRSLARFARLAALVTAAIALVVTLTPAASTGQPAQPSPAAKPTIVLVHGAFADGSSWNDVIKRLQHDGYPVIAPANPLRDLTSDSAYVQSVLATIDGPVVLVGHSYGGAVISNAGNAPNVRALVYVAGFALDAGESLASIGAQFPDNDLGPAVVPRPFPLPDGTTGTDLYMPPTSSGRCSRPTCRPADRPDGGHPAAAGPGRRPHPVRHPRVADRADLVPGGAPTTAPSTPRPSASWPSGRKPPPWRSTPPTWR